MKRTELVLFTAAVGLAALVTACAPGETPSPVIIRETVEVVVTSEAGSAVEVPNQDQWASSAHADASAEAFSHWDEDDPAVIPPECAKCHSTPGYLDAIGADGCAAGVVDREAAIGTVITCNACHNDVTATMDSVIMPSGVEITGLGDESRCMQCHQGRESTVSVNEFITEVGVGEDQVSADLGFRNIHYFAAAATKYGTIAKGGYEYEGKSYDANFAHVEDFNSCVECHNPHTLQVRVDQCSACHDGVTRADDLKNIRMQGSLVDYDGDGNVEEGIYYELEGMRARLLEAIQAYAIQVSGSAIGYDSASYPYFFADANGDGAVNEGEERFAGWTPRLLKAAYNYQVSLKDPGAFAHGGKYILELMFDSIEDLNSALSAPVVLAGTNRIDDGHFAGSEEAFRHWDADGAVPATCSKCHSAAGMPLFVTEGGVTISQPPANGFQCTTCHNDLTTFTRYEVVNVKFPSGAVIDSGDPNMNLCMTCHQGRTSTNTINSSIAGAAVGDDVVSDKLRFANIHYFAAGATRFGTEVKGGYEYSGNTYLGFFPHVEAYDACTECHTTHRLDVKVAQCAVCHAGADAEEGLTTIRMSTVDYDGDGDTGEGMYQEVATMREALLAAIQSYAVDTVGTSIGYNPNRHPYFFIDSNGDGTIGSEEGDGYASWTPRLLRAAYNYQYATKDPGAFAHNGKYVLQLLYDALRNVGGDVSGMVRP